MPVSAPADKRFRRAHVHPGKKRAWLPSWRRMGLVLLVAAAGVYGISRTAGIALTAEALTITNIDVSGTKRLAPGEAEALLEGLRGASMVTVDLEAWRQKLLEVPWVADAAMRRVFPGTVAVAISEREPLGIGRIGNVLYLIDQQGNVIDEFGPNYAEFDLPIIDGLAGPKARPGAPVDPDRAALAGRVLTDFQRRPDLGRQVSQVDVSNMRDAVVILKDDPVLIHVGDDRFVDRLQSYLDLAPRLREQVQRMDYVDLRFGERWFVGTAGK